MHQGNVTQTSGREVEILKSKTDFQVFRQTGAGAGRRSPQIYTPESFVTVSYYICVFFTFSVRNVELIFFIFVSKNNEIIHVYVKPACYSEKGLEKCALH